MQAAVSAFLFALITDRALLVEWAQSNVTQHWNGEEKVAMAPLSNFFHHPDIDWDFTKHRETFEDKIAKGLLTESAAVYSGLGQFEGMMYKGFRGTEAMFQCSDYNDVFTEDVVSIRADNYFALNMLANPFYR